MSKEKKSAKIKGNFGEEIAAKYLQKINYKILERNFYSRYGEIDIIAEDVISNSLAFVEVKTYKSQNFLSALEAITTAKKNKLTSTAEYYLATHSFPQAQARFDLIVVEGNQIKTHLTDIF